jgi:hypothetical protein
MGGYLSLVNAPPGPGCVSGSLTQQAFSLAMRRMIGQDARADFETRDASL